MEDTNQDQPKESDSPPPPPTLLIVGPEEVSLEETVRLRGPRRSQVDALKFIGLMGALALSGSNTATSPVNDFPLFNFKEPKTPVILPCLVCGKPGPDGTNFCSAKHSTLYYQNQGTVKGNREVKGKRDKWKSNGSTREESIASASGTKPSGSLKCTWPR